MSEPRILRITCRCCGAVREERARQGLRDDSVCRPCAVVREAERQRARLAALRARHPRPLARTCACLDCGEVWCRQRPREPLRCRACRLAREAERHRARREARRGVRGAAYSTRARPTTTHAALALVPHLESGAEEQRVVSVLSAPRVVDWRLGLRLGRVHVWGELTPREIAAERIGARP